MKDSPDSTADPAAETTPDITGWPFIERRKTDRRQGDRRKGERRRPSEAPLEHVAQECTEREREIVDLLLQGMTNKQIAERLGIAVDTVKKHLQHVYKKLGVRRRVLLIADRSGPR